MAGDGFSVKSTISQMTNVARALQKSQQIAQTESAAAGHLLKGEKRVDRLQPTDEAQKTNVDPDRRRREGDREHRDRDEAEAAPDAAPAEGTPQEAPVSRIDTTA
jgi:hypothetical protein